MWSLAAETTQSKGSLTLFCDQKILDHREWNKDGSHSEFITVTTAEVFKKYNITGASISRLAVGIGPGSFTGIRVGLNFIRTLAYVFQIPVFCINSLELLASQIFLVPNPKWEVLHCIQYGFRDLYYYQSFRAQNGKLTALSGPAAKTLVQIKQEILVPGYGVGTGFKTIDQDRSLSPWTFIHRDNSLSDDVNSSYFLKSGFLDQGPENFFAWNQVAPLYIRASEAEEKLRRGQLKPS